MREGAAYLDAWRKAMGLDAPDDGAQLAFDFGPCDEPRLVPPKRIAPQRTASATVEPGAERCPLVPSSRHGGQGTAEKPAAGSVPLSPRLARNVGQGADNRSPTPNSITSSTATSSDGDTSRRRAFAVLRFSTSSLGLVPLRMRSTKKAVRPDRSEIRAEYDINPPASTFCRKAKVVGSLCLIALASRHTASGKLTNLGSTPTEKQPRGFNIDPAGRFVVVSGEQSDTISSYAIDAATGALKPIGRYPTGKGANSVEIVAFD
jgi:lactonase family protein with 7-bladed beta-propeller